MNEQQKVSLDLNINVLNQPPPKSLIATMILCGIILIETLWIFYQLWRN